MLPQTLQCSTPEVVFAFDPEGLEKSVLQEPPVEQKQEEDVPGAESALSEAATDNVGLKDVLKKVGWKLDEFIAFRLSAILALKFCRPIKKYGQSYFQIYINK